MTPQWERNNNPEAHLSFSNPISPLRGARVCQRDATLVRMEVSTGRICRAPEGSSAKLHNQMHQGITSQPWHQPARGVWNGIGTHLQGTPGFGLEWESAGTHKAVQVLHTEELRRHRSHGFPGKVHSQEWQYPGKQLTQLPIIYSLFSEARCNVLMKSNFSYKQCPSVMYLPYLFSGKHSKEINRRSNFHAAGKMNIFPTEVFKY